ncbi:HNH endonuclease signature motif containing protein [Luteipulveratus sp. YIM 133132]|uniref:HNH endonuclease signature motif containing protein n=1 Tax=Luteipulveratus flavus TaxID=3031728 RepID=UPI0023AF7FEA|nr:HNH endonuclease signature motif containing protein [Luteipulveratus sp. YIM 133132]MDE9364574.1 HNH endonuclease signature motif containing protein [Luteipulveratus sp. YIM 133132]
MTVRSCPGCGLVELGRYQHRCDECRLARQRAAWRRKYKPVRSRKQHIVSAPGSSDLQRFMDKVRVPSGRGCWLWLGALSMGQSGYGQFRTRTGAHMAHRWLWERQHGAVPDGLQLDHLCRVTRCVNPEHLEPVTPAENDRRARAKARSHDGQVVVRV